jgi:uncharacterized membrane protein YhaH (DUF805 family)
MDWYFAVLKKYAVFEGRARRKEYWLFALFNFVIAGVLAFIDSGLGLGMGLLSGLYGLALLIPGLALAVRRLHDTNHSGWWLLITLIPIIGPIIFFIFTVMDSDPGENDYGPNPKDEF